MDSKTYEYIQALQRFEKILNWELSSTDLRKFIEIYEMTQGQTVCITCKSELAKAKQILIDWKNNYINQHQIDVEKLNKEII